MRITISRTPKKRLPFVKNEGSYVLQVVCAGGTKADIVVDSGDEDNVCPWQEFLVGDPTEWLDLRG